MPCYKTISELVSKSEKRKVSLGKSVFIDECEESEQTEEQIFMEMMKRLKVMHESFEMASKADIQGELYKRDAFLMKRGIEQNMIPDDLTSEATMIALAISAWNSLNGKIVAAPTGGSCGILPGILLAAQKKMNFYDEQLIMPLFAGAGVGITIDERGTLSGSVGGCQAECGVAAVMAAVALTELLGGSPLECSNAFAIACKASMGLICDPIGNVAAPCVKRNGLFASVGISAAYMARCGVESAIPPDEMLSAFCETSLEVGKKFNRTEGRVGIQCTDTACKYKIF